MMELKIEGNEESTFDFLIKKAETNRDWLNLLTNTPINQTEMLQKKALELFQKDASKLLSEHKTHLKPFFN